MTALGMNLVYTCALFGLLSAYKLKKNSLETLKKSGCLILRKSEFMASLKKSELWQPGHIFSHGNDQLLS